MCACPGNRENSSTNVYIHIYANILRITPQSLHTHEKKINRNFKQKQKQHGITHKLTVTHHATALLQPPTHTASISFPRPPRSLFPIFPICSIPVSPVYRRSVTPKLHVPVSLGIFFSLNEPALRRLGIAADAAFTYLLCVRLVTPFACLFPGWGWRGGGSGGSNLRRE